MRVSLCPANLLRWSARSAKATKEVGFESSSEESIIPCLAGSLNALKYGREQYYYASPIQIEIIGLKDLSCSPFPAIIPGAAGCMTVYHRKLVVAFNALADEIQKEYGIGCH